MIACEFSGIVREAFRKRGHDAWSCDFLPTEIEGNHIQGDVLEILGNGWDLMVAHPPCTYLCRNNARCLREGKWDLFKGGVEFFRALQGAPIEKVALENPVPHLTAKYYMGGYSQIIQPWMFGHDYSKRTCLWLKNLPPLFATELVEITYITTPNGFRYTKGYYKMPRTTKARSRTFQGIANAMAEQWG